ncbi:MAG: hypothetical protein U9M96_06425 [Thermodesulfobacteriota bacterium]|nr:hypothetical protein [Thermodesulfobacteriota bacterium]
MKRGKKKHIKPSDVEGNLLYVKDDEEPESGFFISTENSEIGEKIVEQTKGEVKVDKSIDFFLRESSLSDDDSD